MGSSGFEWLGGGGGVLGLDFRLWGLGTRILGLGVGIRVYRI